MAQLRVVGKKDEANHTASVINGGLLVALAFVLAIVGSVHMYSKSQKPAFSQTQTDKKIASTQKVRKLNKDTSQD